MPGNLHVRFLEGDGAERLRLSSQRWYHRWSRFGKGEPAVMRYEGAWLLLEEDCRFRDLEISTDLSSEKLIDFSVSWNSRGLLGRSVDVDRVIAALS